MAQFLLAYQPFDADGAHTHFAAWGYAMSVAILAGMTWAIGGGWVLDTVLSSDSVVAMESGERFATFLPLILLWLGGTFGVARLLYIVTFPRFRQRLGERSRPASALGVLVAALTVAAGAAAFTIALVIYYTAIITLILTALLFMMLMIGVWRR